MSQLTVRNPRNQRSLELLARAAPALVALAGSAAGWGQGRAIRAHANLTRVATTVPAGRHNVSRGGTRGRGERQALTGPPSMGTLALGARELGKGRLPGGSSTVVWEFSQILDSVVTDGAGKATYHVVLTNALFTRMAQLLAMYDRCRLKRVRFMLWPMGGSAQPGQAIGYFDYRGSDAAAATLAAASLMQDAKVAPCNSSLVLDWKPQDPIDQQFIDTAQTVNFHNDAKGHSFNVVVEGAGNGVTLYQVFALAQVEYTARI